MSNVIKSNEDKETIDKEIIDFRKLEGIITICGKKTLLLLLFLCAFCGKKTIVPLFLFKTFVPF